MKKNMYGRICLYAVALLMSYEAGAQQAAYHLKGNIKGLNGKVYLQNTGSETPEVDSVMAVNGVFQFRGKLAQADVYVLKFAKNSRAVFFLEAGENTITGNVDSVDKFSYGNKPLQQQYKSWQRLWSGIAPQALPLYKQSEAADKLTDSAARAKAKQEVQEGFAKLDAYLYQTVDSFVTANPASPVAAYIIFERYVAYPNLEKATMLFGKLTDGGKNSLYGKKISADQEISARSAIGVTPAFTQPDTLSKPVSLTDFRGKYVLVDFWASWCGPCRKENPNVVAAYHQFHDKGFDIISVSLDSQKQPWLNAIHKDGLTWTHVSDLKGWKNEAAVAFGVKAVPTSLLLDKNGVIIAKDLRGEELQKKLQSLLGE